MTRSGKFVVNTLATSKQIKQCPSSTTSIVLDTFATKQTEQQHQRQRQTRKLSTLERIEYIILIINRLLIGFVCIYLLWMCLRVELLKIPWHAVLCTIGFVCLMTEGLLAHYRGNASTALCYRSEKTQTHWILQLLGSLLGIAGIIIKITIEEIHFESLHAQLGLVTLVLCVFSLCSGLLSLYANYLKSYLKPLINKTLHNIIGILTFSLAMASMYTAFNTNIFNEYSLDASTYFDFHLLMQISIVFILILSTYGPLWCLIYSKLWKSF